MAGVEVAAPGALPATDPPLQPPGLGPGATVQYYEQLAKANAPLPGLPPPPIPESIRKRYEEMQLKQLASKPEDVGMI